MRLSAYSLVVYQRICDLIATKILVGVGSGITASSLCINRRLAIIATSKQAIVGTNQKRNAPIVDLSIGLGAPIVIMAASYVVQAHRFDIGMGIGCLPVVYPVLPALFLVVMWPLVFSLISAVYGGKSGVI